MDQRPAVRRFVLFAAALTWSALALQFALSLQLGADSDRGPLWGVVMYTGYFTILSNLLVAVALTAAHVAPASAAGRYFARPSVITGVAAAIVTVGLAYFFLLRLLWNPQGWQFVADVALHYAVPILFLVYWWLATASSTIRWRDLPVWTLFPIAYLVYALVRGWMIGSYPYPFIDVGVLGYRQMLVNALGILGLFLAVGVVLVAVVKLRQRLRST